MSGASALQAAHQVAPKVSHTGCPLYELSETLLPSTVVAVKSCAGLPTLGGAPLVGPDSSMAWRPDAAAVGRSIRQAPPMTMVAVTARTERVPSRLSRMRCCQPFGFVTVGSGLIGESSSRMLD